MKKILLVLCCAFISLSAQKADLIIFSCDRPLQLYALLESTERYIKNLGGIHVIYRSSNERYDRAYYDVFTHFPKIVPIKQGERPHDDFKPFLLRSFFLLEEEYIMFAVDDIVVKDYVDCAECITSMQQIDAYGFYLRLGNNITYCYSRNQSQQKPPLCSINTNMYSWTFPDTDDDWGYPHTVDMTIYHKKNIEQALLSLHYKAPNSLEFTWSHLNKNVIGKQGLCYINAKIVNLPLNIVQHEWIGRNENLISPERLLALYEWGLKLDINPLHSLEITAPHVPYMPTFTLREQT